MQAHRVWWELVISNGLLETPSVATKICKHLTYTLFTWPWHTFPEISFQPCCANSSGSPSILSCSKFKRESWVPKFMGYIARNASFFSTWTKHITHNRQSPCTYFWSCHDSCYSRKYSAHCLQLAVVELSTALSSNKKKIFFKTYQFLLHRYITSVIAQIWQWSALGIAKH